MGATELSDAVRSAGQCIFENVSKTCTQPPHRCRKRHRWEVPPVAQVVDVGAAIGARQHQRIVIVTAEVHAADGPPRGGRQRGDGALREAGTAPHSGGAVVRSSGGQVAARVGVRDAPDPAAGQ